MIMSTPHKISCLWGKILRTCLKSHFGKVIGTETEFFLQNSVSSEIQKDLHDSTAYSPYS